jgi:hypothetical protein
MGDLLLVMERAGTTTTVSFKGAHAGVLIYLSDVAPMRRKARVAIVSLLTSKTLAHFEELIREGCCLLLI